MQLEPPDQQNGSHYTTPAASPEKERAEYTGKGEIHYLAVENKSAAKVYAHVYDGADHTGTLIHAPIPVEAHGIAGFDARYGIPFSTGLYVGLSDTEAWSAHAGADGYFTLGYSKLPGG